MPRFFIKYIFSGAIAAANGFYTWSALVGKQLVFWSYFSTNDNSFVKNVKQLSQIILLNIDKSNCFKTNISCIIIKHSVSFLSNVLTKRRIWDIFDQSEAILSGSNEQILLTSFDPIKKRTHCICIKNHKTSQLNLLCMYLNRIFLFRLLTLMQIILQLLQIQVQTNFFLKITQIEPER